MSEMIIYAYLVFMFLVSMWLTDKGIEMGGDLGFYLKSVFAISTGLHGALLALFIFAEF